MAAIDREPIVSGPAQELLVACDAHLPDWWRTEALAMSPEQTMVLKVSGGNDIRVLFSQTPGEPEVCIGMGGSLRRTVYEIKDGRVEKAFFDHDSEATACQPPDLEIEAIAHVIRAARPATFSLSF